MSRSNPLFVDSTKSNGDGVGTQIELTGLVLREDERASCLLTDSKGRERYILLKDEGEGRFSGQTWLNHQEEITLRFIVEGEGGGSVIESPLIKREASYALVEAWSPEEKSKKCRLAQPEVSQGGRHLISEGPLVSEKLGELISKWGL
ncbi:hypothetical protein OAQ84_00250 [Bdellovibrionales bacterium]|nr:hypothetical protein [Bdellovibrionales bacterium]